MYGMSILLAIVVVPMNCTELPGTGATKGAGLALVRFPPIRKKEPLRLIEPPAPTTRLFSVAPTGTNVPLTVSVPVTVSWLRGERVAPALTVTSCAAPAGEPPTVCGDAMTTSSPAAGTTPPTHVLASSQFPLCALVIVSAHTTELQITAKRIATTSDRIACLRVWTP